MPGKMPEGFDIAGIIGGGTIGASWTALFLAAGLEVDVYDPSESAETFVRDYLQNAWPQLEALGLVSDHSDANRLHFVGSPEAAVERADFVQESVPERIEIKHELFGRIEAHLKNSCIVASSASGLLVKDMQKAWQNPGRFILGHPFNPPHLIPLVELLGNEQTEVGVLDQAKAFYEACGKVTINVRREVPGHVANRLQAALWREAIHLVMEGVASVEDVDRAVSAGPGLRWSVMGPHMLFSLGSGGSGIKTFCGRYADSFHHWWKSLGAPVLTEEVSQKLAAGVADEEAGRSFDELTSERDEKIIAALRAFHELDIKN